MLETSCPQCTQPALHAASVPTARGELLDRGLCGDSKDNGHEAARVHACRRVPPLCERFWVRCLSSRLAPPNTPDRSSRGSLLSQMESCTSDTQRPSTSTLDMQRFRPLSPSDSVVSSSDCNMHFVGNRGWYVRFCSHGDAVSQVAKGRSWMDKGRGEASG